jgi:hypothetical protein
MIGFTAEYEGGEIEIDPGEILEAGWFKADRPHPSGQDGSAVPQYPVPCEVKTPHVGESHGTGPGPSAAAPLSKRA